MSYAQLEQQLTDLHLASIRKQYQTLAQQAAQANWSFETYLAQLIDQEFQRRTMNRRRRRIKEAKFPLLTTAKLSTRSMSSGTGSSESFARST